MNRLRFASLLFLLFTFNNLLFCESEPNNTYQQANTLALNGSDGGSLNEATQTLAADAEDWWKITLPSDGSLYFDATGSGNLDVDLYIFDVNGATSLASGIKTGQKESVKHLSLKAGTYYLRVYRGAGTGSYTIQNKFTAAPYANDQEPNDSYQQALTLSINTQVYGHIRYYQSGSTDFDDWYKVTVPSDGGIKFIVESDSCDIDLYLVDVNGGTTIKSAINTGLKEEMEYPNLMPGTYFLRIYGTNAHGGYILTNTFTQSNINGFSTNDNEKNDTYQTAVNWGSFGGNSSLSSFGHLGFYSNGYTDYDDYWIINTTSDGKLVVKTESNSTLDVDLYLIDIGGNTTIKSAYSTGASEQLIFDNLGAGKFYLRVYRANGYGSYKISADFSIPLMSNDVESNDTFAEAKSIVQETKMTGHLGYFANGKTDYDDYYAFTLTTKWDSLYIRSDSENSLDVDLYLVNSGLSTVAMGIATGKREILKTSNVNAGSYYIRAYRANGQGSYALKFSNKYLGSDLTDIKIEKLPTQLSLSQNYPNPFNPTTNIDYELPEAAFVKLVLYDVLGRELKVIVNGIRSAGRYSEKLNMSELSSGTYIYRLQTDKFTLSRKLMLLK